MSRMERHRAWCQPCVAPRSGRVDTLARCGAILVRSQSGFLVLHNSRDRARFRVESATK
jgi:hypothetical protein